MRISIPDPGCKRVRDVEIGEKITGSGTARISALWYVRTGLKLRANQGLALSLSLNVMGRI